MTIFLPVFDDLIMFNTNSLKVILTSPTSLALTRVLRIITIKYNH